MSIAMPSVGCLGPCRPNASEANFAGLILEEIDGVAGVMPQQVIGPTARLAERVEVGAAEEIGLHVHLLDLQFAGGDLVVDPLMAGVEAPHVPSHRDETGLPLRF